MTLKQAIKNLLDSVRPHTDWTGTNWEVDKKALDDLRCEFERHYNSRDLSEWDEVLKELNG